MRSVDLALYADALAARASLLAAQLERARGRCRQAALEREARRALDERVVARLESHGFLACVDLAALRVEARELAATLGALEELQAWVEGRLFAAREEREGFALSD